MQHVDICYARVCGLCTKAIDFFRSRGVSFTAHAVEYAAEKDEFIDSDNTREMYLRCGGKSVFVPQMFIGTTHIKGWKMLEPMIGSGEIDPLVPKPLED